MATRFAIAASVGSGTGIGALNGFDGVRRELRLRRHQPEPAYHSAIPTPCSLPTYGVPRIDTGDPDQRLDDLYRRLGGGH